MNELEKAQADILAEQTDIRGLVMDNRTDIDDMRKDILTIKDDHKNLASKVDDTFQSMDTTMSRVQGEVERDRNYASANIDILFNTTNRLERQHQSLSNDMDDLLLTMMYP